MFPRLDNEQSATTEVIKVFVKMLQPNTTVKRGWLEFSFHMRVHPTVVVIGNLILVSVDIIYQIWNVGKQAKVNNLETYSVFGSNHQHNSSTTSEKLGQVK